MFPNIREDFSGILQSETFRKIGRINFKKCNFCNTCEVTLIYMFVIKYIKWQLTGEMLLCQWWWSGGVQLPFYPNRSRTNSSNPHLNFPLSRKTPWRPAASLRTNRSVLKPTPFAFSVWLSPSSGSASLAPADSGVGYPAETSPLPPLPHPCGAPKY